MTISTGTVFTFALLTAIATGLGALPFVVFRQTTRKWLAISNAIAAGLMAAATASMIYEGLGYSGIRVGLGVFLGLAFIAVSSRFFEGRPEAQLGKLRGADALKALVVVGVMTIHSVTEGVGIGVSFGGGEALGLFITTAIAIHNIPEGLAISLVLVPRGESVWRAAGWSIFSSLPQPLLAVPAFLFVETFEPLLPVGLGFAGGAMIWMVLSELIPDALKDGSRGAVLVVAALSMAAMLALQVLLRT